MTRPAWHPPLAESASASPWQWIDLLHVLFLVAIAQLIRRPLPASLFWDVLAFHGPLLGGIAWRARGKPHPFGLSLSPWATVRQAVARWLMILPILWMAALAWHFLLRGLGVAPDLQLALQMFMETDTAWKRLAFIGVAVVIAPLSEEALFRGILQPLLVRRFGATIGIGLLALGFAALHADLGTFVSLAVFSVALSLAIARTGSLWVSVLMHSLFNGVNLLLLTLLIRAGVV